MKIIVTAIALAFAFPAAAQTAPAQHADHAQHQPGQHQHGQGHADHQGQHQQGQHEGHEGGCCADRNNNGRMDCCEEGGSCEGCREHDGHRQGE